MTTIHESIFGVADREPDRPCLLLDDGSTLTYGELDGLAARVAGGLRARGVGVGDRVVVQVPKSASAVACYLGCLRAGAVYVPLNTAYTATEVDFFVTDAEAALLVDDAMLEELQAGDHDTTVADRTGDDWAAMLYTSGTTGRPKGAMLSCHQLAWNARALHDAWGFRPDDVLIHVLPVFHVHGLFVALHCAFLAGTAVRFHERFDPDAVRADLRRSTVLMGVPTHYHRLLDQTALDGDDCARMRLFTSGSAPLLPERHDEFAARTGHRIVERYGMSETMILTTNPLDGERIAGTVGFPLPGVELRIAGEDGGPTDADEVGGVEVRGDCIGLGYWRLPDASADATTDDGWFVTGDVGSLDDEGRLTLSGRATDLIISGGLNIYPREIEEVLDAVDGVAESAVIGIPDEDFGEQVVAVVVGDPTTEPELRATCEQHLARFKHPRRYEFVDELPRNTMGKVQKTELRERLSPSGR